jgi:hypothetical protein
MTTNTYVETILSAFNSEIYKEFSDFKFCRDFLQDRGKKIRDEERYIIEMKAYRKKITLLELIKQKIEFYITLPNFLCNRLFFSAGITDYIFKGLDVDKNNNVFLNLSFYDCDEKGEIERIFRIEEICVMIFRQHFEFSDSFENWQNFEELFKNSDFVM